MRRISWILVGVASCGCFAAGGPAWWSAFLRMERLESAFVHESESSVFGTLRREGRLRLARGGRLRVEYTHGPQIMCDGRTLVHLDPETRTAQRIPLQAAMADMPLLKLLQDPSGLESFYRIQLTDTQTLRLEPKRAGLPPLELQGNGAFLTRLSWTDPTGAKQVFHLRQPYVPKPFPLETFAIRVPVGTRWLEGR